MSPAWLDRIEQGLLFILAGFLFWPYGLSNAVLILLLLLGIIRNKALTKMNGSLLWYVLPPIILLFAWIIGGFQPTGWKEIQLWLIGVAALFYFRKSRFKKFFLNSSLVMGIIQSMAVIGLSGYWWATDGMPQAQLLRDQIGSVFSVHPTYMSAFWLWGGFLALPYLEKSRRNLLLLLPLLIGSALTGGKMPFLAFVLCLPLYFYFSKTRVSKWTLGGVFGLLLVGMATLSPVLSARWHELIEYFDREPSNEWLSTTELRIGVWNCTLSTIEANWMLGTGLGNSREALETCYSHYENEQFFETEFNTHNQYLHFWLVGGLISFLAFLIWFFGLLKIGWKHRQDSTLLLVFLCYFGLLMLTENYFSRQAGITMFALFTFSLLPPHASLVKQNASN